MIIVGYQGIGKSSISGYQLHLNGCSCDACSHELATPLIDLESGNFWVNKIVGGPVIRDADWYIPYCAIAQHLSDQGFHVFTASHKAIRDYLNTSRFKSTQKALIYPSLMLKESWIQRLQTRYDHSRLDKDYKALMNAKEMYDENIDDLMAAEGFIKKEITSIDYNLRDIIDELVLRRS